jgi:hypothetical protein
MVALVSSRCQVLDLFRRSPGLRTNVQVEEGNWLSGTRMSLSARFSMRRNDLEMALRAMRNGFRPRSIGCPSVTRMGFGR